MAAPQSEPRTERHVIQTGEGEFELGEYRLRAGEREWSILNTGTLLTHADEQRFLRELRDRLPYGVALWPSSLAMAHEIASRPDEFRGKRVLELGSGTGLPGIVAATLGAQVVQTDNKQMALTLCKINGERNGAPPIDYRLADWTAWSDTAQYDWIIGSDIMYNGHMKSQQQHIFETNLAPGGKVLLADPLRETTPSFLHQLEAQAWTVRSSERQIGNEENTRTINIFEITAPDTHQPRSRVETNVGDFPLSEYRLRAGGREWSITNTGALMTPESEQQFIRDLRDRLPYGVALWPSAIALTHEIASRPDEFHGKRVLELGSGTGLPGIVAATLGAQVVQTDNKQMALALCKINGERNGAPSIDYRIADWTAWDDTTQYDWIIGSDILYNPALHGHLQHIFETNLVPDGKILLADPLREPSTEYMDHLEAQAWTIWFSNWQVGDGENMRTIGLFEIAPPNQSA